MTLRLPYRERRRLHDRAYRAQQRDQSEVCGAMVADSRGRCRLVFLPNRSDHPGSFEMKWADVHEVARSLAGSSARVVAVFHSHVASEAVPSPGDLRKGPTTLLNLIYDVCGRTARLWRIKSESGQRRATEVPIVLESSSTAVRHLTRRPTRRSRPSRVVHGTTRASRPAGRRPR